MHLPHGRGGGGVGGSDGDRLTGEVNQLPRKGERGGAGAVWAVPSPRMWAWGRSRGGLF